MLQLLTNSISIIGIGLGSFSPEMVENKFDVNNNLILIPYISPTLNLDPWESYKFKKHQEISDKILEMEIKQWKN